MRKKLLDHLSVYAAGAQKRGVVWRGQMPLAKFLMYYLIEKLNLPDDRDFFWHHFPDYLPQILADGVEELRTSTHPVIKRMREEYERDTGGPVPNVFDIGASDLLEQGSFIQTLRFTLQDVIEDPAFSAKLDSYFNAQRNHLMQVFDKFLRVVYRPALFEIIKNASERGMSGKFGQTELRSFCLAGRLMLSFARKGDEHILTFIGEEGDKNAWRFGIQSFSNVDFQMSLAMVNEVIEKWPSEAVKQAEAFRCARVMIG